MSPRDLFGVVLRTLGLGLCLFGVFNLFHLFLDLLGESVGGQGSVTNLIANSAFFFLLGAAVLLGADWLARALYDHEA